MSANLRRFAGLRSLGICLSAAVAVVSVAMVSGSPAGAAPPVGPLGASIVTADDQYGTIKGRLIWGGADVPEPKVLEAAGKASKDPAVCAANAPIVDQKVVIDPKTKGIRYAFAYIPKPKGENPDAVQALVSKTPTVEIDQKGCIFIPRSVALNAGQELLLKSSDPVNHNVHLNAFTNLPFNILLPANGKLSKKLVAEKRALPLTCDIHPWMKSNIMVFDHPFFAVTGEDGSFEIKGVPAGTQNLVIWQEGTGYVNSTGSGKPVEVAAGKTTDLGEIQLDPLKVK